MICIGQKKKRKKGAK